MARIKYSGLIENIAGSIGGTTFQRNAYGYTIKAKPNMLIPSSQKQRNAQYFLSIVAAAWRNLTNANRLGWNAYAEANPVPSRLNPDAYLSGYNLFQLVNQYRIEANQTILAQPSLTLQSVPVVPDDYILLDGSDLIYETDVSGGTGDWVFLLYLTPVMSQSRQFVNFTPRFMQSNQFDSSDQFSVTTQYVTAFGSLPAALEKIGFALTFLCLTTAQVHYRGPYPVTVLPV